GASLFEDIGKGRLGAEWRRLCAATLDSGVPSAVETMIAGVRVRAVQANVGEVDLLDTMLDVVAVPAPGSAALLCLGGLAMRRRRG
ncbi:MAG: PEP-CTERM sorting domain-containing protein, partial [Planctomycetota bacterium]